MFVQFLVVLLLRLTVFFVFLLKFLIMMSAIMVIDRNFVVHVVYHFSWRWGHTVAFMMVQTESSASKVHPKRDIGPSDSQCGAGYHC